MKKLILITGIASVCLGALAMGAHAQISYTPTVAPAPPPPPPPPPERPKPKTPVKAPSSPVSFVGRYKGSFDGGNGTITVTGAAPRYAMSLFVGGDQGCSGEVSGPAASTTPGSLVMSKKTPDGGMCRITLARSGATWTVSEDMCGYYHGASCAFDGTARKLAK